MPIPRSPVPGLPHPDVEIVMGLFRASSAGDRTTHHDIAKAINVPITEMDVIYRRAYTARRRLYALEGISIVAVPGVGYYREHDSENLARVKGKERKSAHKKAGRVLQSLACIDPTNLNPQEQYEYFTEVTLAHVARRVTGHRSKQLTLAATKVAQKQLPMAQALDVLKGDKEDNGKAE